MKNKETVELQCRHLLMNFYSSELRTHSRLITGFSVILLTLVQIILSLDRVIFSARLIIYGGVFLVSFAIWFSLMRHLLYGILVHSITVVTLKDKSGNLLAKLAYATGENAVKKKILAVIPTSWFLSREKGREKTGFFLCLVLALVTTFLLIWVLD